MALDSSRHSNVNGKVSSAVGRGEERCINAVLICRAINRVEGSRWVATVPCVSANESAGFTASTHACSQ